MIFRAFCKDFETFKEAVIHANEVLKEEANKRIKWPLPAVYIYVLDPADKRVISMPAYRQYLDTPWSGPRGAEAQRITDDS